MNAAIPNIDAYPKTIMLRDGAKVDLRPLAVGDELPLLEFFKGISAEDRFFLKENVTAPEMIHDWTTKIDFDRIIPIVGEVEGRIIADATLHRGRSTARRHVGEIRIVVDPAYRKAGLGRRLIRELLDIAADLNLLKVTFELVADRENPALNAASSVGFEEVAVLKDRIQDFWGNFHDLVLLEMSLKDRQSWWY